MRQHIDLYAIFSLDPHAPSGELARIIDGYITHARTGGTPDGSSELRRLDVARRILGDDIRRRAYDERLRAGAATPTMDVPALEQLAYHGSLPEAGAPQPSAAAAPPMSHAPYPGGSTQTWMPPPPSPAPRPHAAVFKALRPADAPMTVQVAYWLWIGAALLGIVLSPFQIVPPFASILVVILAAFTVIRRREAWAPLAGTVVAVLAPVIEFLWRVPHVLGSFYGTDAKLFWALGQFSIPNISIAFLVVITLFLITGVILQWLPPSVEWYTGVTRRTPAPGPASPQLGYGPPQR